MAGQEKNTKLNKPTNNNNNKKQQLQKKTTLCTVFSSKGTDVSDCRWKERQILKKLKRKKYSM